MNQRRTSDLVVEAKKLIENSSRKFFINQETRCESAEAICTLLLRAFTQSADMRFFEHTYALTFPLFEWFTKNALKHTNISIEPESVLARFFRSLCERLLSPIGSVPDENFFGWCYCLIENIINAMKSGNNGIDTAHIFPSTNEAWQRRIHLPLTERIQEHMAEILFTHDAGLHPIEKQVLDLFYRKQLDLNSIATKIETNLETTEQFFNLGRLKVMNRLYELEAGQLWSNAVREDQP